MRKCRFCAEEIQDAAIVCKHCGRDLIPGRTTTHAPDVAAPSAPPAIATKPTPVWMKASAGVLLLLFLIFCWSIGNIGLPILLVFIGLLVWGVRAGAGASTSLYCPNCGSVGAPTTRVKGSFGVEVLLWICFLLPGLIYSLWRMTSKEKVCPSCGAPNMIPANSPKAVAERAPTRTPTSTAVSTTFGFTRDAPGSTPPVEPPSRRAWVPGPPKHAVPLSALPIGDATHHDLGSGDGFSIGIVGESYRQGALHDLAGSRLQRGEHVTFIAALIPEPENSHDANAIRVDIQGGEQVGYLSRDDAVRYRPTFAALTARHLIGVARAKLIGGVAGKPSIGVILDLNQPLDVLSALAPEPQPF